MTFLSKSYSVIVNSTGLAKRSTYRVSSNLGVFLKLACDVLIDSLSSFRKSSILARISFSSVTLLQGSVGPVFKR